MMPESTNDYLRQLERELQQRGRADARLVEEAREHLADAAEDGRRRGLSLEDAEREAIEIFGTPSTIAAHVAPERPRMSQLAARIWDRKWWMLAPAVLTAVATGLMSYHYLPTRYRSESVIRIVSPDRPDELRPTPPARFEQITQIILSRPRLEWIIRDFSLYQREKENEPLRDFVPQMQRDIRINLLTSDREQGSDVGGFKVSFVSSDPTMAMKITERLASLFIEENLRAREAQATGTTHFIDAQINDVRRRLIAYEGTLDELRAQHGAHSLSRSDLIPYEVLQQRYKALLIESEESRVSSILQRGHLGEKFVVIDPARVPERPLGPSRLGVNVAGAFAGLGLGLVLVGVRSRTRRS